MSHSPGGGNVQILDQPFDKNGIRSRIDTGFIFEEVVVPIDYEIKTPRSNTSMTHNPDSRLATSRNANKLQPIHESVYTVEMPK